MYFEIWDEIATREGFTYKVTETESGDWDAAVDALAAGDFEVAR